MGKTLLRQSSILNTTPHPRISISLLVRSTLETGRFYVDFATKVVTAERLLWERALKASCVCEQQSLEAESAFVLVVAPVIEKLVRQDSSGGVFSSAMSETAWISE